MAGSSSAPALVATFVLAREYSGLVVLAASAAIFFFVKANGSPLFRDELRLALVLFLATSALWGILEFAATLVSQSATSACQVAISFATIFDQLARFSVEQFLLWGVNGGMKVTKLSLVLQGALFLRFIIGAVFVGVQRPQFDPVCVASNLVLPIGIIVMVVDMAMTMALSTKAVLAKNGNALRPELSRSNTLIYVAVGSGIWTGLSTPLFLGLKSTSLAVRTVLPAIGLLILIAIVALSAKNFVPPPSTSGLKIQKTVSFDSTTHIEIPTRNLPAQAFPSQNGMTRVPGALPLIRQPPSGQATEGIGGLPVEGELFPPIRAQTAPVRPHHKKQMSDRAFKGGKIVISKPIVQVDAEETSNFDNIPTVDLATAAMKEKERRELRPAAEGILSKALSPNEIMGRSQSFNRKQVPQSAAPNNGRNLLSVEEPATAITSAVQLSPGIEETRRRSPRQVDRASPSPPIVPSKDEARTPKSAPLQSAPKVLVPPPKSTKRPPPIKSLQAQSPKENNAMPGVAISRFSVSTMDPMTARIASSMFSPQEKKLSKAVAPPPPAAPAPVNQFWVDPRTASLPRSNSVKNNIRPSRQRPPSLPMEEEKKDTKTPLQRRATVGLPSNPRARATRIFTREQGATNERQMMFINHEEDTVPILAASEEEAHEEAESPSRKSVIHRPRPIPRKSTASASELLGVSFSPSQVDFMILSTPNLPLISPVSVKSLSRSEYIAPSSSSPGSLIRYKSVRRTSFVPDLPAVPVEYQGQQPKITEEASVEASTTNVWTVVPNDQGLQMPGPDKTTQRALCISKFSVDTALTVEEPRSPYNSRLSINTQSSYEETIGRNSSVVFATEYKPNRFSSLVNSFTERLTRHGSVDSEFSMMLRNAPVPPKTAPGGKRTAAQEDDEMTERPVVIDMSMSESSTSMGSNTRVTTKQLVSWHHRVGEELPSFSSQLKYRRSRKLMVPKPLALYRPANVTVVIEAEPSPVEPPQEALDKIHEQLKKFDIENGDARATISEQQRMTILANLESEMGAQESQWQMLRVDLAPSSPSTIVSSSGINSLRSSVDISKFEIMPITKLNGSAGDLLVALNEDASRRLSTSSDLSKEEMLESGDDKLNRRSLSASGRMSLLSVTNRTMSQIGSPTPPDTDESAEEDSDNDSMVEGFGSVKDLSTGLMPRSQASTVTSFLVLDEVLSSSSEDLQNKLTAPLEFEDVSLITPKAQPPPVEAQPEEPETEIATPIEAETIRFSLADLEQPAPRPRSVTRRPPRQSKRISALPDIVENPEPLAGKTGTLGIFQFPWGEKSDSARVPPRMVGISGTMSSGRGWANPSVGSMNAIQEKQADHSPETAQTFLDDDEFENGLDNYEDEEYDDGFDEATLWEIASLLESDLDTSRDDLFMVGEENWEDQTPAADELPPTPSEVEDVSESVKEEVYDFIPVTLASESSSDNSSQVPALWTGNLKASKFLGLPQPSEGEWNSYFAAAPRSARAVPRVMEEPAQLSSISLWTAAWTDASKNTTGLWCAPAAYRAEEKQTKAAADVVSLVWSPQNLTKVSSLGLPQPEISVWNAYIPQAARTVRRTTRMPEPAVIETTSLWALKPATKSSVSKGVWSPARKSEEKPSAIAVAALWFPLSLTRDTMMGLPQPEINVWNSYISPVTRTVHKTTRMPLPAVIETTSLWALKSAAKPSVSNGVWSPALKEDSREVTSLTAPTVVPSLWLLPSAARGNAWALPQPDIQVWNSYMSSESRVARRTPQGQQQQLAIRSAIMWSAEPLRTIEVISTKLWSLKTTTLLWAPSAPKDAGVGLPQPDVMTWNTYIVSSTRSVRRNANVLKSDVITSTSLWAPLPVVVSQPGGVWKAKSLPVKPQSESSLKVVKDLLWSPSSAKMRSVGLPQPDANTWNMYLLPASRSYRKAYLPRPSMITSTSLWVPVLIAESPSGGVWKAKSQPSKSQATKSSQKVAFTMARDLLWTPSSTKSLSVGLSQPDAESWSVYLVPASRSHRGAYVPRLVAITSTSLWSPTLSTEAHLGGVWQPKFKQSPKKSTKAEMASLWTSSPTAKPSFGLPQPISKIWESYIPPMASSTFRRVLTLELASLESRALWSPSPKTEAAQGYLWCPKQTQAEKKRPGTQSTTATVAARSPVSSNERTASVRKSMPVLMTHEQWNSAFKSISQEMRKDATSTNAPKARATRLNRSQSVKSRPFFDPSVMALISEYPALPKSLGRSKSISALPASRRVMSKASSHAASASVPNVVEPSQPATATACLWTKLPLALPESSDKASMWQQAPRQKKRADVHPPSFVYSLPGPRRTAGRRIDLRHNITPPTSFRAGQGLWTGN
ncbi:hypothetical protein TARUN_4112 [Trichoderma arundinaceum]|uniref:Uncharacterized protein n=1 Tax=Trichoderma arundinaceum TaxID=490622 RepID=A0A395NQ77_TRIAR|nr:hypothetical protein TARUN_4112 [Trichoderma arundinaceum]